MKPRISLRRRPISAGAVDHLGTRTTALRLAAILRESRESSPFILAIDGGWGIGKSSLLQHIAADLADDKTKIVEFNAWTASGDLALEKLVKSVLLELDPRLLRRWVRKLARRRNVSIFVRLLLAIGVRLLGMGKLVDQFWDQTGAGDQELRRSIGELLSEWVTSDTSRRSDRSLVVFVDDLDRCSDDTIVRMCEGMKLYLDVPGLIFVLACDLSILANGVSTSTGISEQAGRAYLEKIIQVTHRVTPPSAESLRAMVEALAEESGTTDFLDPIILELLADQSGRNPRQVKRILNSFVLTMLVEPAWNSYPLDPTHALTATLLQHLYPQLYDFVVGPHSGDDPVGDFLDYALVKRRATDVPRSDDAWWTSASRVFRRAGLPIPQAAAGADITLELSKVERALPEAFPGLVRNYELTKLLKGIGNASARVAMRAQLSSTPLASF